MVRLFVAAWPPDTVVDMLRSVELDDGACFRLTDPSRLHITLAFIGDGDPELVSELLNGADLPTARAELGPRLAMLGQSAVVVPVSGLDQLAAAVQGQLATLLPNDRILPFRGHLTIARARRPADDELPDVALSGSFDVSEVSLVESHQSADGSRYVTLASWPTVAG